MFVTTPLRAQTVTFGGAQSAISSFPAGSLSPIAVDAAGDIFAVSNDGTTNSLIKVGAAGGQTVLTSNFPFSPQAVAVNAAGTALYFIHSGPTCPGRSTWEYVATTIITGGVAAAPTDLPCAFSFPGWPTSYIDPHDLKVDSAGNVYIADFGGGLLWEIPSNGTVPTKFLPLTVGQPYDIAISPDGYVYFTYLDYTNANKDTLGRVQASSFGTSFSGTAPTTINSSLTSIQLGLVIDSSGNILVGGSDGVVYKASGGTLTAVTPPSPNGLTNFGVDSTGKIFTSGGDGGGGSAISTTSFTSAGFGFQSIGSATAALPLQFSFVTGGKLGSIDVLTQGASGLDFANAGSGTCNTTTTFAAGNTCTVDVTFTPKFAGLRMGAVVLKDGSGNALSTTYISGIGQGPQVAFSPGTQSAVGGGLSSAWGVVVDASGNVYIADMFNDRVLKAPASDPTCSTASDCTTVGSGLSRPAAVAVDGGGNVYIADHDNNQVVKLPWTGSGYGTQSTVGSGLSYPAGVAVDGSGNVYIGDYGNSRVVKVPWSGSGYGTQSTMVASGLDQVYGVAVDGSGNLYIADGGNNKVLKVPASDPTCATPSDCTTVGSVTFPTSVAVDGGGNVYIADYNNQRVVRVPWTGSGYGSQVTVLNGSAPSGVAVDGNGNIYIVDRNQTQAMKLDLAAAPSLSFPTTDVGAASPAQDVVVQNIGNAPLNISSISTAANFTLLGPNTTCASNGQLLNIGLSCILGIEFAPQTSGDNSGSVILTDDAISGTQTIALSGTASATAVAPVIAQAFNPTTIAFNATTSLTLTITNPAANTVAETGVAFTDVLPTGLVVSTPNGLSNTCSGTATAVAGSTSITLTGGSIAVNASCTVTVNVTGVASGPFTNNTGSVSSANGGTGNTASANLTVSNPPPTTCLTDTTLADFQAGVATNCDYTSSPGNVTLVNGPQLDQQNTSVTTNGFGFTFTSWAGQTFTPSVSGPVTRVDLDLFCSGCSGTTPDLTVSIRATTGSPAVPTGADLATAMITGFSNGTGTYFTANFATPFTVTAGTQYAIVMHPVANPSAGVYAYVCSCTVSSNPYTNGSRVTSSNSGTTWTADITSGGRDLGFKVYVGSGFASSGTFTSSVKDAGVAAAKWQKLSWTADTPAGTNVQFQVAASSNVAGPFNFVGPDGTASTFFGNGDSLALFLGNRYLKYQASLSTSNAATPTLHDVTVCFNNTAAAAITKTFGASQVPLNATTSLSFTIHNPDASVTQSGISFTDNLPAGMAIATPGNLNSTCSGTATAVDGSSSVSLSGGTLAASASCTVSVNITGTTPGIKNNSVQVTSTEGGTGNTSTASLTVIPDTTTTVTSSQNPLVVGQPVTFTATVSPVAPGTGTPTGTITFLDGGSPLGTGALSGGVATFTSSALSVGNHTITTSYGGDGNFSGSAGSLTGNPQVVNQANTTTTVNSLPNPSTYGQSVTFTATVSPQAPGSGTATGTVTFSDNFTTIGTGTLSGGVATYTTSTLGVGNSHGIVAIYVGDTNFTGSTSATLPLAVTKANSTTVVNSSRTPSTYGQSVTFTATVSPQAPGSGTATGTVTFSDNFTTIGTGTLSGGVATYTTSTMAVNNNHGIVATYVGDTNFTGSTSATLTQAVNKADTTTTVTSSRNSSTYGQSVTFTATVSPVAPGSGTTTGTVTFLDGGSPIGSGTVSPSGPNGVATFTTSALTAGNHTITTSYGGDGNFNGSTGTLTGNPQVVNKATLTVTANSFHKLYGNSYTPTGLEFTTSGLVNGDTVAAVTLTSTGFASTATVVAPGPTYTITPSAAAGTGLSNYSITYVNGTVAVDSKPLTVNAMSLHKTYGNNYSPVGTEFTTGALVNGDTVASVTLTSAGYPKAATVVAPGPTYTITPSAAVGTGLGNYTIAYNTGTLTVDSATLTVTANSFHKGYGNLYAPVGTEFTTAGLANGDTVASVTLTSSGFAKAATVTAPGPTYTSIPSAAVGTGLSNYTITYIPGTITVDSAPLTITANNQTKAYGSALPSLTASYNGFVNGDTAASLTTQPTLTTTATAASSVAGGPYVITASGAVDPNYSISYVAGSMTITSAPLTITANNQTKAYGGAVPSLTASYSGFVNGDTAASLTTQPTLTTTATAASSVAGSPYAITASGAVDPNYSISYVAGSMTITSAPLTITANNQVKTYGSALPSLTASYSGFVNGDTAASLTTQPTLTTTATAASSVAGSPYTITASGAVDPNYSISYVAGNMTITKLTASVSPNAQSKTYGANDPTLGGTLAGFLAADNVTANYSRAAGETVAGGPYTISATLSPAAVLGNYTITYNTAAFTINKATASVTPNAASKTYGANDPAWLIGTVSGFLASDNVTASYSRVAGETVAGGPYTISATLTPAAVLGNYTITYNTAEFTINKATASVTPNAASKTYGATDPALSGTLAGFLASDNVTASYSRAAGETVAGGPYTISATLNPAGVLGNYTITYNTAAFTINKATASATLQTSAATVMLKNNFTLTAKVTSTSGTPTGSVNFMDGATSVGSGTLDNTGNAALTLSTLSAGAHSLTAVYAGDANFNSTTSAGLSETVQDFQLAVGGSSGGSVTILSATVLPGGVATYQLQVAPTNGTTFSGPITLSLSGLPAGATYTITPSSIASGSGAQAVTVQVQTLKQVAGLRTRGSGSPLFALALLVPMFGIVQLCRSGAGRTKRVALVCLLLAVAMLGMSACGGGSGFLNQAPQTYTLQLNAASGALQHSTTLNLTIQ